MSAEPVASAALPMPDSLGTGVVIAWLTVEAGLMIVEAAWLEGARLERRRVVTRLVTLAATEQRPGLQLRVGREVAVAFLAADDEAPVLAEARLGFDDCIDAVALLARPPSWSEPARALSAYVRGSSSRLPRCFIVDAEARLWGLGGSGAVLLDANRPVGHDLAIVAGSANLYELRQAADGTLRLKDFPALW